MKSSLQLILTVVIVFGLGFGLFKYLTGTRVEHQARFEPFDNASALEQYLAQSVDTMNVWSEDVYQNGMGRINATDIDVDRYCDRFQQNLLCHLDTLIVRAYRGLNRVDAFQRVPALVQNYRGVDFLRQNSEGRLDNRDDVRRLEEDRQLYNDIYTYQAGDWSPAAQSQYTLDVNLNNSTANVSWTIAQENLSPFTTGKANVRSRLAGRLEANTDLNPNRALHSVLTETRFNEKIRQARSNYISNESNKLKNFFNSARNDTQLNDMPQEVRSSVAARLQQLRSAAPAAWDSRALNDAFSQAYNYLNSPIN